MQSNPSFLKQSAILAATKLHIELETKRAKLVKENQQGTWDYSNVLQELGKLSVAIVILQDLYVN